MTKKSFSRLPASVVPNHYLIKLKPDLVKLTFQGEVTITVEVKEPVSEVLCNGSNLEIQSCSINCGGSVQDAKASLDQEQETVSMKLSNPLTPGSASIKMSFTGVLNDKMCGFYRTKYTVDGEDRYAAVTQFEATDARQAFPCWDEPAVKATFDMVIVAPKDRVVLSNMPEIESQEDPSDNSCKIVKFSTSPIMSTYLVAIVVGEFDFIEDKTEEDITVRVYSPLGKKEQGRFALECAVQSLTFYSKFFKIPYPLPKYDMIAIPDFSAGAMENWGLVLYRETCILVDPLNSSQSSKQWVAIVVNHETAHQWFGNLVTMEWWTHLWLNEGFASFMENLTTDALYPEYKIWEQFVPGTLLEALELDALKSSHPIEVEVGHPSEVDEIFDNISYNKGASVIRMLYNWIGDDSFKKGMNSYLSKYSYKNTLTPQLWAELEAASGQSVTSVMKTWTEQMGYPVISVSCKQDGADMMLTLKQTRFVGDGSSDESKSRWMVPISIISSSSPDTPVKMMLDAESESCSIKLPGVGPKDWIKLNPGVVGYYRVSYSPDMLTKLCDAVSTKALCPVDRLNILDDLFSLIAAGKANTVDGLRLLKSYKQEDSYIVWNNIVTQLAKLSIILADQEYYETWLNFQLDLFSVIKKSVSWDPNPTDGHLDTLLRSLVLSKLGQSGDQEVRAEAKRRFDAHASGGQQINPDIRAAVYKIIASMGQEDDYNAMLKLHDQVDLHEERTRILWSGLGCFNNKELLAKSLEMALGDKVRSQDSVHFIGSVAARRQGRDLAWQFFKDKFVFLKERYSSGFLLSRLVKSSTIDLLGEDKAREVETYFEEHPIAGSERNVAQSCETIRLNTSWIDRDGGNIEAFFKSS